LQQKRIHRSEVRSQGTAFSTTDTDSPLGGAELAEKLLLLLTTDTDLAATLGRAASVFFVVDNRYRSLGGRSVLREVLLPFKQNSVLSVLCDSAVNP